MQQMKDLALKWRKKSQNREAVKTWNRNTEKARIIWQKRRRNADDQRTGDVSRNGEI